MTDKDKPTPVVCEQCGTRLKGPGVAEFRRAVATKTSMRRRAAKRFRKTVEKHYAVCKVK